MITKLNLNIYNLEQTLSVTHFRLKLKSYIYLPRF